MTQGPVDPRYLTRGGAEELRTSVLDGADSATNPEQEREDGQSIADGLGRAQWGGKVTGTAFVSSTQSISSSSSMESGTTALTVPSASNLQALQAELGEQAPLSTRPHSLQASPFPQWAMRVAPARRGCNFLRLVVL